MGRTRGLVLGLIIIIPGPLVAADPPVADTKSLVITGALIRTQTEAGDFIGTIVIRDGKIVALGRDVPVPAAALRIDASNCIITPGLIDAHSTLGLNPAAANESGRDAALNILDAFDPFSDDWRDAARQGITAVYVQPGGTGNLSGSGAVICVGPAEVVEGVCLRSPAAVQLALGMPPATPAQTTSALAEALARRGFPAPPVTQPAAPPPVSNSLTRYAQYEQVRGVFSAAKSYGDGKPARKELPKELLLRAIKSEIPVRIEVHHEDDIRNAQKLSAEFNLQLVFERIERARLIPEEFRSGRFGLVIGPLLGGKPSAEVRNLALDGRRFAIGTFAAESRATAGLRFHTAAAAAAGYPRDVVLRALTSDAAEMLGVGDKLGRIAVGRTADLVIFAGDPLDPSAPVRLTICQGKVTFQASDVEIAPLPTAASANLPDKLPPSYVIKTTRLQHSSGALAPGEIHVVNGRFSARGNNGNSAPVFDLGDTPVTPGLVAAHVSVGGETAPDADAAHLKATDGLAPDDSRLRNCRDAGFLTALAAPGSANVLAGVSSAVRAGDTLSAADIGVKFVLTAASRSNNERYPVSLAGQIELVDARLRLSSADTNLHLPPAVREALLAQRNRTMQAVRDRRLPAIFEAQTRAEIRAALRLITEHKLRGILLMPRDVDELTDEIRQAGVAVIVGPVRPQDSERTTNALVALSKAGVPLAFGGEPAEMRISAAWLVNAGLPRQTARLALVGQPAEALGLPAGIGRLQAGDTADFVIWTGDPLDTASRPAAVVVQGQRVAIPAGDDAPPRDDRRPTGTSGRTGRRQ